MYRVIQMTGKFYAMEIDFGDNEALLGIESLLDAGDMVILVNDLDEIARYFDVDEEEIIVVVPEEGYFIDEMSSMNKLTCPKCQSKNIVTTLHDRWCRRCGYRSATKPEFETKS